MSTVRATTSSPTDQTAAAAAYKILVDGDCPLCRHEGNLIQKLDKGRGLVEVVDLTDDSFDPADYGTDMESVLGQIHGVKPNGEIVTGMQVFRDIYNRIGWGWLWAPTGWPVLRPVFDMFYRWFARNRYRITFRKNPCEDGTCKV
ncbi:MAG: DUF393 domain-containing protein [Planctomycetota bacterium]